MRNALRAIPTKSDVERVAYRLWENGFSTNPMLNWLEAKRVLNYHE